MQLAERYGTVGVVKRAVCAGLLLSGCFYVDPLNDPPVIRTTCTFPESGRACDGDATVHRGERIELRMAVDDPDENDDPSTHRWQAFTCVMRGGAEPCTRLATGTFQGGVSTLAVPASLVGVRSIAINFQASDELGASDSDAMVFPVNDAPTLQLGTRGGSFVIGAPIAVFATYGDLDDGPSAVTLRWQVVAPNARLAVLEDLDVPAGGGDPGHATAGKTFVPDTSGDWVLTVTATDASGEGHEEMLSIPVGPDPGLCPAAVCSSPS